MCSSSSSCSKKYNICSFLSFFSRYRDSSLNRPQDSKRSNDFIYEHQSFFSDDKGWKKKKEDDSRGDRRMCSSDVGQKRREKRRDYMDRKEEHPGAGYHRYLVIDSRYFFKKASRRKILR